MQAPVGFWDLAGFTADGEATDLARHRQLEPKHGRRIALASVIIDTRVNYAAVFLLVLFWPRALSLNGQRLLPPSRSRCASRSRR